MSNFDINSFVDQLEVTEAAQDMHYSLFYNPEHFEGEIYDY